MSDRYFVTKETTLSIWRVNDRRQADEQMICLCWDANIATKIATALNQQHRAGVERAAALRRGR